MGMPREFSEKMAEMIDEEIQSQLLALEKATLDFLTEHRNQLDALAKAVLKQETLSAEDVEEILRKEDARKIA
jgi:cell division protease FtsH